MIPRSHRLGGESEISDGYAADMLGQLRLVICRSVGVQYAFGRKLIEQLRRRLQGFFGFRSGLGREDLLFGGLHRGPEAPIAEPRFGVGPHSFLRRLVLWHLCLLKYGKNDSSM
jgi:hypothetical protein